MIFRGVINILQVYGISYSGILSRRSDSFTKYFPVVFSSACFCSDFSLSPASDRLFPAGLSATGPAAGRYRRRVAEPVAATG
jgi:hypothetical protein